MLRGVIDDMISKNGANCFLRDRTDGTGTAVKAIVYPMRYKYKDYAFDATVGGIIDERYYICITSVENDLSLLDDNTVLELDGKSYHVDTSEIYRFGAEPLYCRTVLRLD